jgi:hypothetical protein
MFRPAIHISEKDSKRIKKFFNDCGSMTVMVVILFSAEVANCYSHILRN